MCDNNRNIIELKNVYKIYRTADENLYALNNINLNIKNGEYLTIIGQSGSGKTTLMNIIGCLDIPSRGTYLFDGTDVSTLNSNELSKIRNQKIGFIFQSFNLIPTLSALENTCLPLLYRGIPKSKRKPPALKALEMVGLSNRINHKPSQLSGGQQQRVAIARARVSSPDVILADEPTGNLDSKSGNDIMRLLENLNKQGKTLIIITHDNSIANRGNKQISISDGFLGG